MALNDNPNRMVPQVSSPQRATQRVGVIMSYDMFTNTATVVITGENTDAIDEILRNVPCPVYMGIQTVAPEPGRPCMVIFRNGAMTNPLITHYYNHSYERFDYPRLNSAAYSLPTYMVSM